MKHLAFLIALLSTRVVTAQSGFALDRFDPAERGSDWFEAESLDLRGHLRPTVGATIDWAHNPLVVYNSDGSVRGALVQDQLFLHLGGALVLWNRLRVGANIPILLTEEGRSTSLDSVNYVAPSGAAFGDVRLGADVRLFGEYRSPVTLAIGVQFGLPTGSRAAYTGDGSVRILPRAMVAGAIGWFEYAGKLGFLVRTQTENFGGTTVGSEISLTAAAGARLAREKLLVGPEFTTATTFAGFFKKTSTPIELLFSGHYTFLDDWKAGLGVGPGLSRGYGTPQVRIVASIDWSPSPRKTPPPEPASLPASVPASIPASVPASLPASIPAPPPPTPAAIRREAVVRINRSLEKVKFKTNSAVILPESAPILLEVIAELNEHPDIAGVDVHGHTDSVGTPEYNLKLSRRRAASVVKWLTAHGVDGERLKSAGFGLTKPIDTNQTDRGRANNRRVEFHIERKDEPAATDETPQQGTGK